MQKKFWVTGIAIIAGAAILANSDKKRRAKTREIRFPGFGFREIADNPALLDLMNYQEQTDTGKRLTLHEIELRADIGDEGSDVGIRNEGSILSNKERE